MLLLSVTLSEIKKINNRLRRNPNMEFVSDIPSFTYEKITDHAIKIK